MSHIVDIRDITPNFGAQISGIDVRNLAPSQQRQLQAVLDQRWVVVIRDQNLTASEQASFSATLGKLYQMPYINPLKHNADVIAVLKEADEINVSSFGSWWHSDFSYLPEPPIYSVLHAIELPPWGGDTLFANMIGAFESLSNGMQRFLTGEFIMHSGHIYGRKLTYDGGRTRMRGVKISTGHKEAEAERQHPLVRHHSPTGRGALNANPTYCTRFAGMTKEESKPLLNFIYQHATRPENTIRQTWREGDLLIWDNRVVTHLAVNDYDGHRRLLHRTTVGWETPTHHRSLKQQKAVDSGHDGGTV